MWLASSIASPFMHQPITFQPPLSLNFSPFDHSAAYYVSPPCTIQHNHIHHAPPPQGGEDGDGLFEDEETRQFYEMIPDLKSLIPMVGDDDDGDDDDDNDDGDEKEKDEEEEEDDDGNEEQHDYYDHHAHDNNDVFIFHFNYLKKSLKQQTRQPTTITIT